VVPKGFVRVLGKLAEISDAGIDIYFFVGNHDMWMNGYFENELNIKVFYKPQNFMINNKKFLIGHGDGLGPGDIGFKRMKKIFTNSIAKFLFRWIHPDIGVGIAQYFSMKNKLLSGVDDIEFKGDDNEWLVQYAKEKLNQDDFQFFIFGHRHLPLDIKLSDKATYINLGDWISYYSFAEFDGSVLELKYHNKVLKE
jgi:UDP-2,3-diacylglucosamine hydrolase